MSTIAQGGLFPPIIDAYLPAVVVKNENPFISFDYDLSEYNDLEDIKSVHLAIVRQSNYHTLFNEDTYRLGVCTYNFSPGDDTSDPPIPAADKQHIDLFLGTGYFGNIINRHELAYGEYYKLQVRASTVYCPELLEGEHMYDRVDDPTLQVDYPGHAYGPLRDGYDSDDPEARQKRGALSRFLTNEGNLQYFSEWSTVCLIRFISEPNVVIKGNQHTFTPGDTTTLDTSRLTIYGRYRKQQQDLPTDLFPSNIINAYSNDPEYLSSYEVTLKNNINDEVIFRSGEIKVDRDHPDRFYYDIPYFFNNNDNIKMLIKYTTANLYTDTLEFNLAVSYETSSWANQNYIDEVTSIDTSIGKINISFMPQDTETPTPVPAGDILTIRRGCDQDGFTLWDTIWKKTLTEPLTTTLSYDDFTIESGNLYKYEITYTHNGRNYTIVEGPVMSVFDHAFLTGEGTQLCVQFNPVVSGFKINVSDNIVNTLGGKYPFIQRNGDMYYRSFTLNGTIAYEMDEHHQFTTRTEMYGEWIDVYGSYFANHYFNQRNDRVTQRKFREAVLDYFYSDIPKLFRSTPEGNMLVSITDVNLTPKQELARMIYDFSCIVTEIGDASIENCKMYQIQDFGDL